MLKKFNLYFIQLTMAPLFNELRFNIVFRILITLYGATWIGNFIACIPDSNNNDDELFKFNQSNYTFWLISSLIFFWFWISQFKYPVLVYLTVIEIFIIILIYLHLIRCKLKYLKTKKRKLNALNKRMKEEMKSRLSS